MKIMQIIKNISGIFIFLAITTSCYNAEGVEDGLRRGGQLLARNLKGVHQSFLHPEFTSRFFNGSHSLFQNEHRTIGVVSLGQQGYSDGNPYSRGRHGGILQIALVLGAGSVALLSSDNTVKADGVKENHIKSGETVLSEWRQKRGSDERKSAVLVVGHSKAGKSLLIASMMGAKLKKEADGIYLDPSENPTIYPIIGGDFDAQTSYPQGFQANGFTFVDNPGLGETRPHPYSCLRDITLEYTVKSTEKLQLLLVA